jgi:hypothetical protein
MKFKIYFSIILTTLYINNSLAADTNQNFKNLANNVTNNVFSTVANILIASAFILFFYGGVMFILGRVTGKGDMADLEKGRKFMLWGLIAIFVMVSAYGIVKMSQNLLNIQDTGIKIKTLDSNNYSSNDPVNTKNIPAQDIQPQTGGAFD